MPVDQNKAVVKRFFDELCNQRNYECSAELFVPEHLYHDPAIPGVAPGPEAMAQVMASYHRAFPDGYWQVDDMFAADDQVVTRWTGTGTQTGELAGPQPIPPSGNRVSVAGLWVHRLSDGKIVESWAVWDALGLMQQLGVIPSAA